MPQGRGVRERHKAGGAEGHWQGCCPSTTCHQDHGPQSVSTACIHYVNAGTMGKIYYADDITEALEDLETVLTEAKNVQYLAQNPHNKCPASFTYLQEALR